MRVEDGWEGVRGRCSTSRMSVDRRLDGWRVAWKHGLSPGDVGHHIVDKVDSDGRIEVFFVGGVPLILHYREALRGCRELEQ